MKKSEAGARVEHAERNSGLLKALRRNAELEVTVADALDVLKRDPLTSGGKFRGDLLRALIDLPASFWSHHRDMFTQYQATVRAGAIARMSLPSSERMTFWTAGDDSDVEHHESGNR